MNVRVYMELVELFLFLADKAIDAGDTDAAHEAIEHARVQLQHTVRELERRDVTKGATS
ncbi:hypothetical protein [Alicyclobacillus sp. ALC3]|uniref:hypothetical protein n=1 Tax=Alicyclobacillus sp. ALC3 TaxID=2796143 RepID=UPI002377DC4A|nr:hypothetical protein [Alicyclobacillus sp. ALC3]WDL97835.1 hypothetical protein JC200_03635 [Alicyclobacillus sp. ALC3]